MVCHELLLDEILEEAATHGAGEASQVIDNNIAVPRQFPKGFPKAAAIVFIGSLPLPPFQEGDVMLRYGFFARWIQAPRSVGVLKNTGNLKVFLRCKLLAMLLLQLNRLAFLFLPT